MRTVRTILASALLLVAGCQVTPPPVAVAPAQALDEADRLLNVQAFDAMWEKVEATYFHPKRLAPGEVDWAKVRATYRPQVAAAPTGDAARALMNAALATLQETHFAVVAGDRDRADATTKEPGYTGLALRPIHDKAFVWRIDPNSPAAETNLRPGFAVKAIDGDRVNVPANGSPIETIRVVEHANRAANGSAGRPVTLDVKDGWGYPRRYRITPATMPADRIAKLGNLPAMDLRVDARTLAGGVGYFGLSVFLDPPKVMPAFGQFIKDHLDAPGIVIDLRGNPGGLGAMATGLAGFLVDRPGLKLGTMTTRDGALDFLVNPRTPRYAGKVAVLVDGFSLSTSEILARGLQDLGRARVFGQPTPGAALPSTVMRLPNGDLFQFAVADYVSAKGDRLEGAGVTPDEVVPLTRADLLAGRDAPLIAAQKWIASK